MNNRDYMTSYLARKQYDIYLFLVAFMSFNWFEDLHSSAMAQVNCETLLKDIDDRECSIHFRIFQVASHPDIDLI